MRIRRAVTSLAVSVAVLTLATGCSSAVPQSDVEAQVKTLVEQDADGAKADGVECPGDLDAKVDTTMECTVKSEAEGDFKVKLTVTSVDGDTVNFGLEPVE